VKSFARMSLCIGLAFLLAAVGAATLAATAIATGDANRSLCGNEASDGFSSSLPDCRAYERVTPRFQNGFGDMGIIALGPVGDELIGETTPGFAGTESNRFGPYYKVSRTSTGWETTSISPPATIYPGNLFYSASEDLSKSLWVLRSPTEAIDSQSLYLRNHGGTFDRIGSMVPPSSQSGPPANGSQYFSGEYNFAGASAQLSHVFFTIRNNSFGSVVWPGDTTAPFQQTFAQAISLYEYSGVNNARPNLVGVDNKGALISDCATFLGSDLSQDVYNAIAPDGEKVYFTAEGHTAQGCTGDIAAPDVNEVYARVGGLETVPISEPTHTDCVACQTSLRQPAQFRGVSADGSKSFFTTAQELLAGDETENLYEFDFDAPRGTRVARLSVGASAPEVLGVMRVSEDGSHVYFVAQGRLTTEPRGGCIGEETPVEQSEEELTQEGRCRAKQGRPNLYAYERDSRYPVGHVSFVATLAEADESDWAPSDNRPAQATPTGQRLVFDSSGALTQDVTGEGPQVYEYDAQTEELARISRGQNRYPQGTVNANSSFAVIEAQQYETVLRPTAHNGALQISDDGSRVMLSSPAALTPTAEEAAEHGIFSVYEYRSDARITEGDVFLLSGGKDTTTTQPQGISHTGTDAFLSLSDRLLSDQTDSQLNIFDARENGGFLPLEQPAACAGEACLEGSAETIPGRQLPGSSTTPAEGNSEASTVPSAPTKPSTPRKSLGHRANGLQHSLKACRHKQRQKARKSCEKRARRQFKQSRHSSQTKGR